MMAPPGDRKCQVSQVHTHTHTHTHTHVSTGAAYGDIHQWADGTSHHILGLFDGFTEFYRVSFRNVSNRNEVKPLLTLVIQPKQNRSEAPSHPRHPSQTKQKWSPFSPSSSKPSKTEVKPLLTLVIHNPICWNQQIISFFFFGGGRGVRSSYESCFEIFPTETKWSPFSPSSSKPSKTEVKPLLTLVIHNPIRCCQREREWAGGSKIITRCRDGEREREMRSRGTFFFFVLVLFFLLYAVPELWKMEMERSPSGNSSSISFGF